MEETKLSEKQIVRNVKKKLNKLYKEVDELNDLREDYKVQSEWHRFMNTLLLKQYLLEEILDINQ